MMEILTEDKLRKFLKIYKMNMTIKNTFYIVIQTLTTQLLNINLTMEALVVYMITQKVRQKSFGIIH